MEINFQSLKFKRYVVKESYELIAPQMPRRVRKVDEDKFNKELVKALMTWTLLMKIRNYL